MQIDSGQEVEEIEVNAESSVDFCESCLRNIEEFGEKEIRIKLVSSFSSIFFSDIWVAILVATLCRTRNKEIEVLAWGLYDWRTSPYFGQSLPGIVALQMSPSVTSENLNDRILAEEVFKNRGRWQLRRRGSMRTIVELDPQDAGFQPSSPERIRSYLFETLSELELGYIVRGFQIGQENDILHMLSFIYELYDNACNYSREFMSGKAQKGVRFLRIRNHLAADKAEMLRRAGSDTNLCQYLDQALSGGSNQGLMEILVSDFGPGILDHFLSSPKGKFYESEKRSSLLRDIVHKGISSKVDQGAGEGLPKAVKAAQGLRGFLSLRTDRFRLCRSFADKQAGQLSFYPGDTGKVAGSHWQLLWPIIGL